MEAKSGRVEGGAKTVLRIEDLRSDAARLSPEEFADRYGEAFLLLSSTGFKQPKSATSTEVLLLDSDEDGGERTAGVSVRVMPIRSAKDSLTHLVTVGRASTSDVAIADISVSRFHAYFKRSPAGGFQLFDAGSTNGTIVNESSVWKKEAGPARDVKSGDNIRFGQVDVTFLEADALRSYVAKFSD